MNQINQRATANATAIDPEAQPVSPLQRPAPEKPGPRQNIGAKPSAYSETEAKILQGFLVSGEQPIAKREDVIELYNRMVTLLRALNESLTKTQTERSNEDRSQIVSRLDQIEGAVNSMEGALRIELEPILSQAVEEQFKRHAKTQTGKSRAVLGTVCLLAVGLTAGVLWSDVILNEVQNLSGFIQGLVVKKF